MDQFIEERKDILEEIKEIILSQANDLVEKLDEYHLYDISQVIITLSPDEIKTFFSNVDFEFSASIFEYLEEEETEEIMTYLPEEKLIKIIDQMEIDEAVDLLKHLRNRGRELINRFKGEKRKNLLRMMAYKEDEIGAFMSDSFLKIDVSANVKEAMSYVTKEAYDAEYISILYIIEQGKLVGYLKLKDLIVARAYEQIKDIMETRFPIVYPTENKESVAAKMTETSESSIPIINEANQLQGIITHDDLMDIIALSEEEDYTKFAAISDIDIDIESSNLKNSVKSRLPWLMILLGLSMLTSIILSLFERQLSVSNGAILLASKLAVYLPLILGMAGNTGTQSLAVMIRWLTKNPDIDKKSIRIHLFRELKTGFLQGIIIGLLIFGMISITTFITQSTISQTNLIYATVTAASTSIALFVSTILGALIPLFMNRVKIDPAVASGPFITTVSDIITLTIYYSVSLAILLPLF